MSVPDKPIIDLLRQRDGMTTHVKMRSGLTYKVHNIAWGYDMDDMHAHVTTNISPSVPESSVDFFSTKDIHAVLDEKMNVLLNTSES